MVVDTYRTGQRTTGVLVLFSISHPCTNTFAPCKVHVDSLKSFHSFPVLFFKIFCSWSASRQKIEIAKFIADETKQQGRKRRRQFFHAKQPLSLHGRLVWHRIDGAVLLVDHPFAARTEGLDPFGEYRGGDGGFHFCHAVVDGGLEKNERF